MFPKGNNSLAPESSAAYMADLPDVAKEAPAIKTYRQLLDELEVKLNEDLERIQAARQVLDELVKKIG